MARALRLEFRGATCHPPALKLRPTSVMARGNQGRGIFEDDKVRQRFVETLGEACGKTGWRLHAYVLMNNHDHLLAEPPEGNLVVGMKWLQGTCPGAQGDGGKGGVGAVGVGAHAGLPALGERAP